MDEAPARCWADVGGRSYLCAIVAGADSVSVLLFADSPQPGFDATADGRWVREVAAEDCASVEQRSTVCQYLGVTCRVLLIHDDQVFLEYAGTDFPAAGRLGFEQVDRGVYQVWTTRAETSQWAQTTAVLIGQSQPVPGRSARSELR